jgi:hypothetical protein
MLAGFRKKRPVWGRIFRDPAVAAFSEPLG